MQYQEQGQKQTLKKVRYVGGMGMECPHCGESVDSHLELCPSCGRPLHADHCTFCGARMVTIVPSVVPEWCQARSFALSVVMVLVASYVQSVVR